MSERSGVTLGKALDASWAVTSDDVFPRALEYIKHLMRAQNTVTAAHDATPGDAREYLIAAFAQVVASVTLYTANFERIGPLLELDPTLAGRLGEIAMALGISAVSADEAAALGAAPTAKVGQA